MKGESNVVWKDGTMLKKGMSMEVKYMKWYDPK